MPGGNGNLTKVEKFVSKKKNSSRKTLMKYDWRDRLENQRVESNSSSAEQVFRWDNRNILTESGVEVPREYESKQLPDPDTRGQVFRNLHVARNFFDFQKDPIPAMSDLFWYDDSGNIVKQRPAGSLAYFKMKYDSLGRERMRAWAYGESRNAKLAQASTLNGDDKVLEQVDAEFDPLGR